MRVEHAEKVALRVWLNHCVRCPVCRGDGWRVDDTTYTVQATHPLSALPPERGGGLVEAVCKVCGHVMFFNEATLSRHLESLQSVAMNSAAREVQDERERLRSL